MTWIRHLTRCPEQTAAVEERRCNQTVGRVSAQASLTSVWTLFHMPVVVVARETTPTRMARKINATIRPYSTAVAARVSRIKRESPAILLFPCPAGRQIRATGLMKSFRERALWKKIRQ